VTEQEWQACADPAAMCRFVWPTPRPASHPGINAGDLRRKQMLYLAACLRHLPPTTLWERLGRHLTPRRADTDLLPGAGPVRIAGLLEGFADRDLPPEDRQLFWTAAQSPDFHPAVEARAGSVACKTRVRLLRELVGPLPFRPVKVERAWLRRGGEAVVRLAEAIYQGRRFGDVPLLHRPLLDAGCDDPDLLGHVRSPGPHVRGCWALDLLVGSGVERGWRTCPDPGRMLCTAGSGWSERKLRLFAVACCRRAWDLLHDERSRRAVEVAERFADGLATQRELNAAYDAARAAADGVGEAAWAATKVDVAQGALRSAEVTARGRAESASAHEAEKKAQADLVRDIFGNPRFPVTVAPAVLAWNDGLVVRLARTIYEERRWGDMPLLADALLDAGCDNEEMLAHAREQGAVHTRGCWLLDLLLEKE
jgi:hypothetical protein